MLKTKKIKDVHLKTSGRNGPSVRVVGHPLAPIGMGEHVRSVFQALDSVGCSAGIVDIYGPHGTADAALAARFDPYIQPVLGRGINIFCINGDEVKQALQVLKSRGFGSGYNVVYPAWELERYPQEWADQLDRFDEIWAPSKFIYDSISKVATKPVIHMPLACEVKMRAMSSRKRFSIPESAFAFLFFFDFLSYLERKNPFAVLEAFKKTLEHEPWLDTVLVIKTNNSARHPEAFERFKRAVEPFKDQVVLIDQTLSDRDIKGLVCVCDSFVSLHRSEGFGRGMSEAMYLGKPVIATGYSGNMDFCNSQNSMLVDYDLIPVTPGDYPHWEDQVWADPDVDQAADYMVRLVEDQALVDQVGRAGRVEILQNFSYRACGLRYSQGIKLLE